MKYAIVTGASRGLGEEASKLALHNGYHLITLARKSEVTDIGELAKRQELNHTHYAVDLSDPAKAESIGDEISTQLNDHTVDELLIINNAGMVSPIGPVGQINSQEIAKHVSLNLTAPMILVNELKKSNQEYPLTVVNITSGAAERAIYGWNAYCSTKAGINLYTETTALEAVELDLDEKHIAFSPGIMDTAMQSEIRQVSDRAFKDVEQFKAYKKEGQLRSPKEVAELLFRLVNDRENVDSGRMYRVYDLVD